jgi:hypothetical protein
MKDLKIKNHLDNLSNSLDVDNCLFTPELLAYLLRSNKNKSTYFKHVSNKHSKVVKDKEGIYLIAFRVLNKERKSLVYNYIYYNDMLYLTLMVYFLLRNYFIHEKNNEGGKYMVIIDNIFLNYDLVDKYFYLYTKDKSKH